MDVNVERSAPARPEWIAGQRKWNQGWRRLVLSAVFLAYLVYLVKGIAETSRGAPAVVGYVVLAAFCLCYLTLCYVAFVRAGGPATTRTFWSLYSLLVALFVAELPFAHAIAFLMCLYITAITVGRLGVRSAPIVLVLTVAAILVPPAIPFWHDSLATGVDNATAIAIPVIAVVAFAVLRVLESNRALADARAELARLSAENERARIARDLHDLLGHSLTTITIKAGLASRIGQTDPLRALKEITEVETLARQSLTDVRAAVTNYRDVTLAGELATGREVLQAVGITADLPQATDIIHPAHQELFGWVVREGLTNVVRHAHAGSCVIRLSASAIEIVDDGVGGNGLPGNGLSGLRERVAAAGGSVEAGPRQPRGWRLHVSLPSEGAGR